MKNLIYFFVLALAIGINSNAQQNTSTELNKENINYQSISTDQQKGNLPQAIIVKRDKDGTISVYKSQTAFAKTDLKNKALLEKLPFVSLENAKGLQTENLAASIHELDNDKPRQSWYYWYGGWGYNYYQPYAYYNYPVYYYNYAYYPYYYYGYNGCSYYYYTGGCGYGRC